MQCGGDTRNTTSERKWKGVGVFAAPPLSPQGCRQTQQSDSVPVTRVREIVQNVTRGSVALKAVGDFFVGSELRGLDLARCFSPDLWFRTSIQFFLKLGLLTLVLKCC